MHSGMISIYKCARGPVKIIDHRNSLKTEINNKRNHWDIADSYHSNTLYSNISMH